MHYPVAPFAELCASCGISGQQNPTDLVLSVIPHFNACLAESIRKEIPNAAFVTVLTDLADYPPISGLNASRNTSFAEASERRQQALSMGHRPTVSSRLRGWY